MHAYIFRNIKDKASNWHLIFLCCLDVWLSLFWKGVGVVNDHTLFCLEGLFAYFHAFSRSLKCVVVHSCVWRKEILPESWFSTSRWSKEQHYFLLRLCVVNLLILFLSFLRLLLFFSINWLLFLLFFRCLLFKCENSLCYSRKLNLLAKKSLLRNFKGYSHINGKLPIWIWKVFWLISFLWSTCCVATVKALLHVKLLSFSSDVSFKEVIPSSCGWLSVLITSRSCQK